MSAADKLVESQRRSQEVERNLSRAKVRLAQAGLEFIQVQNLTSEIESLKKEKAEAVALIKEYETLLSKSMYEIASHRLGKNFQATYIESEKKFTHWQVSQKAFKEMAIQYGEELEKTKEEVILEANKQKIFVIENLTNPAHETGMDHIHKFPILKEAAIEHAKETYQDAKNAVDESIEKKRIDEEIKARELIDPVFKENRRREAAEKAAAEKAAAEKAAAEKAAAEKAAEEARKKSIEDAERAAAENARRREELAAEKAAAEKAAAAKELADKNSRFRWRVGVFSVLGLILIKYIFF